MNIVSPDDAARLVDQIAAALDLADRLGLTLVAAHLEQALFLAQDADRPVALAA